MIEINKRIYLNENKIDNVKFERLKVLGRATRSYKKSQGSLTELKKAYANGNISVKA